MTLPFQLLDVLSNTPHSCALALPMRIIAIAESEDELWLIPLPGKVSKNQARRDTYAAAPVCKSLIEFACHVSESRLAVSKLAANRIYDMPDKEMKSSATTDKARARITKQLFHRDQRWKDIAPLIENRSFLEIVHDPNRAAAITEHASKTGKSRTTIYYLLHLYWFSGSRKNGLMNNYGKCGSPGQQKKQNSKLGRKTRLAKAGEEISNGYVLSDEEDKHKLAWGYALIRHKLSPHDAWLAVSGVHWAERTIDVNGKPSVKLFPANDRPSYDQFLYWGKLLNEGQSITEISLGQLKFNKKTGARGGSLQDQVTAVGQLGVFDSTSTDTYLVSTMSRLRTLPPMTRLVAQDVRSEVIYGLYCGWDSPSPATALQAILHGATPKSLWCKRFGIDIDEEQWPHQLARGIQADNGELKGSVPTEAEVQFGFGIMYTETNNGEKKGGNESSHKSLHRAYDHKVPGTTHGKARERGETHAASFALWNYYEYMRELIHAILKFNNEEKLELAPAEMLREIPAIKPTRLNIFHWLRKQGMRADLPVDLEALRAYTLPDVKAVVRKNGVYLVGTILGHEQVLPKTRYTSDELVETGLMSRVKVTGSPIHTQVKMDSTFLEKAWLPTKAGMIPIKLAGNDTLMSQEIPLTDWQDHLSERTLARDRARGDSDQEDLDTFLRRQAITEGAAVERKEELAQLDKPPSKSAVKRDLRKHRDTEMASLKHQAKLDQQAASNPVAPTEPATLADEVELPTPPLSAADIAMQKLNDEEFGNGNQ